LGRVVDSVAVAVAVAVARRGGWYPVGAHAGVVGAARRLRCGAQPGVASRNSLRSLRSLRSNTRDESVVDARCARRPWLCASRRPRNRPHRVPPAAHPTVLAVRSRATNVCAKAGSGSLWRASEALRSAGLVAARASAHQKLTRRDCLSVVPTGHAASSATGHKHEHRKAVGAQRRPLKRSATDCPDPPLLPQRKNACPNSSRDLAP
jgi:hypothetical protein